MLFILVYSAPVASMCTIIAYNLTWSRCRWKEASMLAVLRCSCSAALCSTRLRAFSVPTVILSSRLIRRYRSRLFMASTYTYISAFKLGVCIGGEKAGLGLQSNGGSFERTSHVMERPNILRFIRGDMLLGRSLLDSDRRYTKFLATCFKRVWKAWEDPSVHPRNFEIPCLHLVLGRDFVLVGRSFKV